MLTIGLTAAAATIAMAAPPALAATALSEFEEGTFECVANANSYGEFQDCMLELEEQLESPQTRKGDPVGVDPN
ncbi:hypothetical protein [Nocardia sp. NPDC052316]|uniref:hypothetical protein n=1 Tax=Nocardia sp. NPDC052316 TaxID=3364329 RepID=UPI0037C600AC